MLKTPNNPLPLAILLLGTLLANFSTILNAETLDSQVISAGGDRIVASDKAITYTLGQPFVFPNPSSSLQVGFLSAKSARNSDGSGCDTSQEEWACVEFNGLKEAYQIGEIIKIDISLNVNVPRFNRVDLWVVIQLPSGDWLFKTDLLNSFASIPQAFKASLETEAVSHTLVDMELGRGLGGDYVFYAAYVNEGSDPFKVDFESIRRSELVIQKTTLANE
ncbi:MAG: hypothetical protein VSS75_019890 [Candidatus Parabeggiatoa sp.]|nr:hypothetical protein [Candidatus Parabeggiatoa sp.]